MANIGNLFLVFKFPEGNRDSKAIRTYLEKHQGLCGRRGRGGASFFFLGRCRCLPGAARRCGPKYSVFAPDVRAFRPAKAE